MPWPLSTCTHPRAAANSMASAVEKSSCSILRHCIGRPSGASLSARTNCTARDSVSLERSNDYALRRRHELRPEVQSPHVSGVFQEWPRTSGSRPDRRFGDGSGVSLRVRIQPAAIKSVGSIAVLHRPNSRLRAVVYPDLPQNRLHMNLVHSLGNSARARNPLIGMPFHETVEDLGLALRQTRVI